MRSSNLISRTRALLPILYRDAFLAAIDKPSGMLVHRTRIAPDRVTAMNRLRDQLDRWVYPVHRIDRKTTGVLLFALDPETARRLGEAFSERAMRKVYLTVVRGWVLENGVIDHPLKDPSNGRKLEARSTYRRIGLVELPYAVGPYQTARYSMVAVEPHSGRWHQVRRHMRHIAHPVVGDSTHGEIRQNRLFRDRVQVDAMLLHAARLEFSHPRWAHPVRLSAPLPDPFRKVCQRFGWPVDGPF